jgi:hypothetical protein
VEHAGSTRGCLTEVLSQLKGGTEAEFVEGEITELVTGSSGGLRVGAQRGH